MSRILRILGILFFVSLIIQENVRFQFNHCFAIKITTVVLAPVALRLRCAAPASRQSPDGFSKNNYSSQTALKTTAVE